MHGGGSRIRSRAAVLLLTAIVLFSSGGASVAAAQSPETVAAANNRFALDLLRQSSPGNLVLSPLSVATALAMADAGATGETARQIQRVLHVPSRATLDAGLAVLLADLRAPPSPGAAEDAPQLEIADGLWLQQGLPVQPAFLQTLDSDFDTVPQSAGFESEPERARGAVNEWVAARTGHLIPELMPGGSITPETRLVLADAVYLHALWQTEFAAGDTAPAPFTLEGGRQVSVPFMSRPHCPTARAAATARSRSPTATRTSRCSR